MNTIVRGISNAAKELKRFGIVKKTETFEIKQAEDVAKEVEGVRENIEEVEDRKS